MRFRFIEQNQCRSILTNNIYLNVNFLQANQEKWGEDGVECYVGGRGGIKGEKGKLYLIYLS
jgi:hypothetical protein